MTTARAAAIVLAKELRLEFRTRELLTTTVVFALVVVVLFSFAFDPTAEESRRYGPGLLWIAFLFAGSLMLQSLVRARAIERHARRAAHGARYQLCDPSREKCSRISFSSRSSEVVLVPVFAVLYNVSLAGIVGRLIVVLVLGTLGLVITGTVFSAVSAHARMRELLLPLLLLPILAPLLIAAVEATASLFAEQPALDRTWLAFLAGFDIVFLTASWLLCDFLLEE